MLLNRARNPHDVGPGQPVSHPGLPLPLRLLNTVGRVTPAHRIDRFRLDKATVLAEASKATRLYDFGDPGFEKGLDALLRSIKDDVDPHLVGQIVLKQAITDALTNRLLLACEHHRRPWIFEQPLHSPIIVTGLHRSGTTYLHRLLAQDPENYAPPYWQLIAPTRPVGAHDLRRQRARRSLTMRTRMMPDLNRMHTIDADAPEECLYLTASSFESVFFWAMAPVTGYLKWYLDHDRTQKYVEYRAWLQILQEQTPSRRLVLKAPEHLGALDALLRIVPEANVVQVHRDPVTAFASYLSMAKATQALTVSHLDHARVPDTALDLFASDIQRNRQDRQAYRPRIHDVHYANLINDPLQTLSDLYEELSGPVSPAFRTALTAYARSHPQGLHGLHTYSLTDGPIDADYVARRLAS